MGNEELIQTWRNLITDKSKSWVLFEKGTCVILMEPEEDLADQAVRLMNEWGPVGPGSSAGDFSTIDLDGADGWVVTCHHQDILTFVHPGEIGEDDSSLAVGLYGRSKRDEDAHSVAVIHVEDNRQ